MFRKVALAAAGVVLGLTGGLVAEAPALAVTSGCGSVCDNKNPDTYYATVDGKVMRCSYIDVLTPYEAHGVQLRYSPFCRTAWARSTNTGYLSYVTVESWTSSGRRKVISTENTREAFSNMVNDKGMTARACHYSWASEVEYNQDKPAKLDGCTAKY